MNFFYNENRPIIRPGQITSRCCLTDGRAVPNHEGRTPVESQPPATIPFGHLTPTDFPKQANNNELSASPSSTTYQVLKSNCLGKIRFDNFIGIEVIELDGVRTELDELEIARLRAKSEHLGLAKISAKTFNEMVRLVARDSSFDSAVEWLSDLPKWDGTERIERFLPNYLGTRDTPYERAVGRYLWTAMVARLLEPGTKADMMPVIVAPQGAGKSTFWRTLSPRDDLHVDVRLADPPGKLVHSIFGRAMVVWDNLQGIKGKSDFDIVKSFLSREHIDVRSQHKKIGNDRYLCRHIAVGTSTTKRFLRDPAGHRRFLPIDAASIKVEKAKYDKLQLWAEALRIVINRSNCDAALVDFADAERFARDVHTHFLREGRWVDDPCLNAWIQRTRKPFSTSEALHGIGFRPVDIKRNDRDDMAVSLRQMGLFQKRTKVAGASLDRWYSPGM